MGAFEPARGRPCRTTGATDSRSPPVADSVAVGPGRRHPSGASPSSPSGIRPSFFLVAAGFFDDVFFVSSPLGGGFEAETLKEGVSVIFDERPVDVTLPVLAGKRLDGRGSCGEVEPILITSILRIFVGGGAAFFSAISAFAASNSGIGRVFLLTMGGNFGSDRACRFTAKIFLIFALIYLSSLKIYFLSPSTL